MFRSIAFNVFYVLWTVVLGILLLPTLFLPLSLYQYIPRFWIAGLLAALRVTCGIKGEVRGYANISRSPVIYAAKHQSAWDILILAQVLRIPAFVMKRELLWIPIFGLYLWRMRMIAINRGKGTRALKHLLASAKTALHEHGAVVIFPEGTRMLPGKRGTYHSGIAALYAKLHLPIVPVALNSGAFWPRNAFVKKPGTAVVEFLPAIPPGLPTRELMALLEERIEGASAALLRETIA